MRYFKLLVLFVCFRNHLFRVSRSETRVCFTDEQYAKMIQRFLCKLIISGEQTVPEDKICAALAVILGKLMDYIVSNYLAIFLNLLFYYACRQKKPSDIDSLQ